MRSALVARTQQAQDASAKGYVKRLAKLLPLELRAAGALGGATYAFPDKCLP